jgi:hypothetical protein
MLCHNNILKVSGMRAKRQKKRSEEKGQSVERGRVEHGFPLKISFNLCKDSIACFVG